MSDFFSRFSDKRIAVYGLGQAARDFLAQEGKRLRIVGLLDGFQEDGTCFGYPVLSLKEVPDRQVDLIVVAARPSSRRIIVRRIEDFCRTRQIGLTDLSGNDLLADMDVSPAEADKVPYADPHALLALIASHDVISFDIFDTLLMRYVPEPVDVHLLTAQRLDDPFADSLRTGYPARRVRVELDLSGNDTPTIDEIYLELQHRMNLSDEVKTRLQQTELQTEELLLCRREAVCDMLEAALRMNKTVCLTSDMYFPRDILEKFLRQNQIAGFAQLFVSCDYGCHKRNGLFEIVKQQFPGKRILHIGDDEDADVAAAKEAALSAFYIPSGRALMDACSATRSLPYGEDVFSKLHIGLFCAGLFNNPFMVSAGSPRINEPETLGYLLYAPLVTDFMFWLYQETTQKGIDTLLFSSRDGYLPQRLFQELFSFAHTQKENRADFRGLYFLTSRMSAVNASLETAEDVRKTADAPFSGSLHDMLCSRFLMDAEEAGRICAKAGKNAAGYEAISPHVPQILQRSDKQRKNYLRYINSLQLSGHRIGLFDLVSTGSTQMAVRRMTGFDFTGFYFLRLFSEDAEKSALPVRSYIRPQQDGNTVLSESASESEGAAEHTETIYEDYFLLESILTAPHPGIRSFDEQGEAVYLPEERSPEEIDLVLRVQAGITDYVRLYRKLLFGNDASGADAVKASGNLDHFQPNTALSQAILHLIRHIPVDLPVFQNMRWTDPYYHRNVAIREMI